MRNDPFYTNSSTPGQMLRSEFKSQRKVKSGIFTTICLMIGMVMFFSVGRYIPGFEWTLNLIGITSFVAALLMRRVNLPSEMHSLRLYIWLLIIVTPPYGATIAEFVFGQPIWLGLATQRAFLLNAFIIVVLNLLQRGRLSLKDIECALISLAWINLAICAPILMFLNPNNYADVGNLVTDGGGVYNQFVLPIPFIVFGLFYYCSRGLVEKKALGFMLSLPFFVYLLGGGAGTGRVLNIGILFTISVIAGLSRPRKGFAFQKTLPTVLAILVVAVMADLIVPEQVNELMTKYTDAFSVLSGTDGVDDWSANSRGLQITTVLPWVASHPMFGTGSISNVWNGGYKGMFEYLHPSDLGFLGIVFVYGILGLAFFLTQYFLAWRAVSAIATSPRNASTQALLLASCGCLIISLLTAVTTGSIAFTPEQILFYLMLIQASIYIRK